MRKTEDFTIKADGRDKGKVYRLTEMDAFRAEKWGMRVLIALENSGFQIPQEVKGAGMAGIAALGVQNVLGARLDFAEFEPLLDQMMGCVKRIPDPNNPDIVRAIREDAEDIEEVSTLVELRREVLLLHLGFLPAAIQSHLKSILTGAAFSGT